MRRVQSGAGLAVILVAAMLLPAFAGCGAGGQRIAVVDMQRAINETREGQQAKAKLQAIYGERQRDLDKRQALVKQMGQRLEQQKADANDPAAAHEKEVFETALAELEAAYKVYRDELSQREAEAVKGILVKMKELTGELAKRERYTVVLEANEGGAFYYDKGLDLTDQIIRLYDDRYPPGAAP